MDDILRLRMHGTYTSRPCEDIQELSRELMGLHCWFHRNVAFSALIRGAGIMGWKDALTKTWLHRGTLHGVASDDLPNLLALHADENYAWMVPTDQLLDISERVVRLMEDGVYSRAEMRKIFAHEMDDRMIQSVFSPWGGIFVYLSRIGRVAFRDMQSRDFDLIDAEPSMTPDEALPEMLRRYFRTFGPATLEDAAWFLGIWKDKKPMLAAQNLDEFARMQIGKQVYYYVEPEGDIGDIPEVTLLSGFDPLIVSYMERSAILPAEYKKAVINKAGICLPTFAVDGKVAGLWNIRKNQPVVEHFEAQPARIQRVIADKAEQMYWQTKGRI